MGSPEFFKNWSSRDSKYILLFVDITQMADDLLMAVVILVSRCELPPEKRGSLQGALNSMYLN